jgi:hypothetical protein
MLVRHLLSIALLPLVVVALVPRWLLTFEARDAATASMPLLAVGRAAGVLLFAAGLALFVWCVVLFARVGRGTLEEYARYRAALVPSPAAIALRANRRVPA